MKEQDIELYAIELLKKQGYAYLSGTQTERTSTKEVVLVERLRNAIDKLNPTLPHDVKTNALKQILNLSFFDLANNNEQFHNFFTAGVKDIQYQLKGETKYATVRICDFENPENNDFLCVNQFTIKENNKEIRIDILLFINGLPLVLLELKSPTDQQATLEKAYTQIDNYKQFAPSLFHYNAILVISDGIDARTSSLTSSYNRFLTWKIPNHTKNTSQIELLINGMLDKATVLDLIKQFTVFEKNKRTDTKTGLTTVVVEKKIAAYHQYYAVNKAVTATQTAVKKDKRAGVIWHTQGSGKSLSMLFYSGKLILKLDNPTLLVLTDRNDLDDQLFDTFANCSALLRQEPRQAENSEDLKRLLKVASGGVIFTTIQKFLPEREKDFPNLEDLENLNMKLQSSRKFPLLSDRRNIVVIADEAHRSQYDFIDGFARNLRDALPNATFIGFTGTPVELTDRNTQAVFGDYIDIYDIQQAVDDGSTVRIFYESRLAKVNLPEEQKEILDIEFEELTEQEELTQQEKIKSKWKKLEAIVGSEKRLKNVAADIVAHFEEREKASFINRTESKAMIVCMSRRICIDLYKQIISLRPDWHNENDTEGTIKVIMTGSATDPKDWQSHIRSKSKRKDIGDRLKNPNDPLKIAIVRDMWLTGFDAPCLNTLYIDKPMKGHSLMQAIARVNRVYKEKTGGLVVDYLGIASELKKALADYTKSGGKGKPTFNQEDAVNIMLEKYEIVSQLFFGFDFKQFHSVQTIQNQIQIILDAQEHILGVEDGKQRFIEQTGLLTKAFALSVPHEKALEIRDDLLFFQTLKTRLLKFTAGGNGNGNGNEDKKTKEEIDIAIRQMVERAVISDEVIDIFDAAGIKKPDISILSDEFLAEVKGMKHKNLALELLKKLLNDEITKRSKFNIVQSKKFSEILETTIKKYQNRAITSAEILDELFGLVNDIKESDDFRTKLKLTEDEYAFYTALAENESAVREFGDDILCQISKRLILVIKENATIDWKIKTDVRAKMRIAVKRLLVKFGYPPDKAEKSSYIVIEQAETLAQFIDN